MPASVGGPWRRRQWRRLFHLLLPKSPFRRSAVSQLASVALTYLVEKGRLPAVARDRLIQALDDPETPCMLAPLDRTVADALQFVSRSEVPDLPDRIVTATAAALRVPLISRDRKVRASRVKTIW